MGDLEIGMGINTETDAEASSVGHESSGYGDGRHEKAVQGVKSILKLALEKEVNEIITEHATMTDERGHRLVVRNGKGRARKILYKNGAFEISAPRINDRRKGKSFKSRILPSYSRRLNNIDAAVDTLRSRGISGESFDAALDKLFRHSSELLSPDSISSMRDTWIKEMQRLDG